MNTSETVSVPEDSESYKVIPFGSIAIGPLTKKQHTQREKFIVASIAMQGEASNPDALTKPQRDKILSAYALYQKTGKVPTTKADQKRQKAEATAKRLQELGELMDLPAEILEPRNRDRLEGYYTNLTSTDLGKRVVARHKIELIQGKNPTPVFSPTELQELAHYSKALGIAVRVSFMNRKEGAELRAMAELKGIPSLAAKKSSSVVVGGKSTPLTIQVYKPSLAESLALYTGISKSAAARMTRRARRMRKLAEKTLAAKTQPIIEHPNTVSISRLCPNPEKKTYVTQKLAQDFINEVHPDDPFLRPYRCECGALHIGHSRKGYGGSHAPHVRYPTSTSISL